MFDKFLYPCLQMKFFFQRNLKLLYNYLEFNMLCKGFCLYKNFLLLYSTCLSFVMIHFKNVPNIFPINSCDSLNENSTATNNFHVLTKEIRPKLLNLLPSSRSTDSPLYASEPFIVSSKSTSLPENQ